MSTKGNLQTSSEAKTKVRYEKRLINIKDGICDEGTDMLYSKLQGGPIFLAVNTQVQEKHTKLISYSCQ